MKDKTTIEVRRSTSKRLREIKLDKDLKNIDEVINYLISSVESVRKVTKTTKKK